MTDLRQAAQQALEALEGWEHCDEWVWPVSALEQSKRNTTESLAALRAALEQQAEPVAFYVYKPTLPRGHLRTVSDGDLPWVYDQDPSSGFSARMLVAPVTSPPAQRQWQGLTDEEIRAVNAQVSRIPPIDYTTFTYARAVEAKLKERNT